MRSRTIEGMAHGDEAASAAAEIPGIGGAAVWHLHPGMLVASKALLRKNPRPERGTEVRFWLAGNLCRCTGYDKIVRAVLETAAEMQEAAQ